MAKAINHNKKSPLFNKILAIYIAYRIGEYFFLMCFVKSSNFVLCGAFLDLYSDLTPRRYMRKGHTELVI